MSRRDEQVPGVEQTPAGSSRTWNWHPDLPLQNAAIFVWPPNPLVIAKTIASYWLAITGRVVILAIAAISWYFTQPALSACKNFEAGWIAQIYFRNLALLALVAGALHLYFYTYTIQGKQLKFDARPMIRKGRAFTFSDQVRDNMFWSLASGVLIWSAYEAVMMWALANGYAPPMSWQGHQVWFALIIVLIPVWYSFYFYWVHRAEHWPPLYRLAHALHHRNINIGPWSGMAMHPVEHILYLGSVLIHFVIPSHPLLIMFHLQFNVLIAVITHVGFENLLVGARRRMDMGYFFHQLHHRYFECNYGTDEMPWDKWFGTFHDGTEKATEMIRERRRRMHADQSPSGSR